MTNLAALTSHTTPTPPAGYRILRAWQRALDVAAHAHELAATLPAADQDRLGTDLRRAGAAAPAHIAAGNLAYDRAEHRRALLAAQSALARVETLALLAERLQLATPAGVAALLADSADALRLVRGLARVVGTVRAVHEAAPPLPTVARARRPRRPRPAADGAH